VGPTGVRNERGAQFRQERGVILDKRDQPSDGPRLAATRALDEVINVDGLPAHRTPIPVVE
jgi:hypothetical protein